MLTVEEIREISGEPGCGMCGDCCDRDPLGPIVGKYCELLVGPFCALRVAGKESPEECRKHECGSRELNPRPLSEEDKKALERIRNGEPVEKALEKHPRYQAVRQFRKIEEKLSRYLPEVPPGMRLRELLIGMGIPPSMLPDLNPNDLKEILRRIDPEIGERVGEWRDMHLKYRKHSGNHRYTVPVSASL